MQIDLSLPFFIGEAEKDQAQQPQPYLRRSIMVVYPNIQEDFAWCLEETSGPWKTSQKLF